jgi:hypothetical protein
MTECMKLENNSEMKVSIRPITPNSRPVNSIGLTRIIMIF